MNTTLMKYQSDKGSNKGKNKREDNLLETLMSYSIRKMQNLVDAQHLLPDSILCGSDEYIPGL